jgi:PAT family acetyl-CoA transporter-like MFS transporter 1
VISLTDVRYQLLNTFSNLGGTWPRFFVLKGVDYFTVATCEVPSALGTNDKASKLIVEVAECVSDHGKEACAAVGGACVTLQDGYYTVSAICVALGAVSVLLFIVPTAKRLEGMCTR